MVNFLAMHSIVMKQVQNLIFSGQISHGVTQKINPIHLESAEHIEALF
jgi:hypothetical protein